MLKRGRGVYTIHGLFASMFFFCGLWVLGTSRGPCREQQVVPEACKSRIPYFVFMPSKTVEAIKTYLLDRERKLGPPKDNQILFCSDDKRATKEKRPYIPLNMTAPEKC
jgi:hypothetical protein